MTKIWIVTVNGYEETTVIGVFTNRTLAFLCGSNEEEYPKHNTGIIHWVEVEEWQVGTSIYNKESKKLKYYKFIDGTWEEGHLP